MTEIHFYTGLPDKALGACELARKAVERGRKVVVFASDEAALARFDTALWSFDPVSFVPHVRAGDPLAAQTPVVLARHGGVDDGPALPHHEVLFNLDAETPKFFSRFDMLIELVGTSSDDVAAGRTRWNFYKERGYALHHRPREA